MDKFKKDEGSSFEFPEIKLELQPIVYTILIHNFSDHLIFNYKTKRGGISVSHLWEINICFEKKKRGRIDDNQNL